MEARSWRLVIPTARSTPSSRVRSKMDSARVLPMPSSAMRMASASSVYTSPSICWTGLTRSALKAAWSMTVVPEYFAATARTAVSAAAVLTPGAFCTKTRLS